MVERAGRPGGLHLGQSHQIAEIERGVGQVNRSARWPDF